MVVADDGEYAAMVGGASGVGVFEHIARPVYARGLAVPHAEKAIILRAGEQAELLAAPHSGGTEVFIQTFPEFDVMGIQPFLSGAKLLIVTAQRRSAVSRDEAGCVEAHAQIKAFSIKWQANKRLNPCHEGFSLDKLVFVVQRDFAVLHSMPI